MTTTTRTTRSNRSPAVVFAALPGPTRKRTPAPYCYRLTYQGDQNEPGCAFQWDVMGGRDIYQIALERLTSGELRWHCTCADAVYRGDGARHVCKHVKGLMAQGRTPETPTG